MSGRRMREKVLMKAQTLNITINCEVARVYEFVADLSNLPQWAKTFCLSIKKVNKTWQIETRQGPVQMRIAKKNTLGVLDHFVSVCSKNEVFVPMRVVPNGKGSEVIFTVFQQPEMSDENFAKDIKLVKADLAVLKKVLEKKS